MADLNQLYAELQEMKPRARSATMKVGKKREHTGRGFAFYKWRDRYGQHCRIQKSSLAGEDCVWVGEAENSMHLTRKQAADLAQVLLYFSEHGELP